MQAEKKLIETAYDNICAFSKNVSDPDLIVSEQDLKHIHQTIRNIVNETADILTYLDRIVLIKKNNNNKEKEQDNEKSNLYNNTNLTD